MRALAIAIVLLASSAQAEIVSLRCPMASMAIEMLYEVDLAAKTVKLTNMVAPITEVASVDERFVTWRTSNGVFRLTRASRELMQAASADGPWEITAFCVPL